MADQEEADRLAEIREHFRLYGDATNSDAFLLDLVTRLKAEQDTLQAENARLKAQLASKPDA